MLRQLNELVADSLHGPFLLLLLRLLAGRHFGLAVVGNNLTYTKSPLAPIQLGISIFGQISVVQVVFDVMLDWDSAQRLWDYDKKVAAEYQAGLEVFLADHYPIRAGYSYSDVTGSHAIHSGIGYVGRKGSVEWGFSYELSEGWDDFKDFRMVLAIKYFAF